MSVSITPNMARALKGDRRLLCWLFWIEGDGSDLYAWSGLSPLAYGGQTWAGVAHVAQVETIRSVDSLEYVEQRFTLNGLDPTLLGGDLDSSVRGRAAKVWLAALDAKNEVVADPIEMHVLRQETLRFERKSDDTVSLTLTCSNALPFVGRALDENWSDETQRANFDGDEGLYYTRQIALTGAAIDWRMG